MQAQRGLLRRYGHGLIDYARNERDQRLLTIESIFFLNAVLTKPTMSWQTAPSNVPMSRVHNVFPLMSRQSHALGDAHVIVQTIHNFRFLCPNGLFFTRGQVCERCIHGNTLHAARLRCYRNSLPLSALYAATIALHRQTGTFSRIDRFIAFTEFTKGKLIEGGLAPAEKIAVFGNFLPDPMPLVVAARR